MFDCIYTTVVSCTAVAAHIEYVISTNVFQNIAVYCYRFIRIYVFAVADSTFSWHKWTGSISLFMTCRRRIASTHGDHTIRVTDIQTGKCTHVLDGHPRTPWCVAFHPSTRNILASGCLAGEVRIWDLKVIGLLFPICVLAVFFCDRYYHVCIRAFQCCFDLICQFVLGPWRQFVQVLNEWHAYIHRIDMIC